MSRDQWFPASTTLFRGWTTMIICFRRIVDIQRHILWNYFVLETNIKQFMRYKLMITLPNPSVIITLVFYIWYRKNLNIYLNIFWFYVFECISICNQFILQWQLYTIYPIYSTRLINVQYINFFLLQNHIYDDTLAHGCCRKKLKHETIFFIFQF